jgi:hypothetical protein
MDNQKKKQQEKMVDGQKANQIAKPLKIGIKKINSSGRVELLSQLFWCYSFSIQSCLSVSPRQVWSPPVVVGRQAGALWSLRGGKPSRAEQPHRGLWGGGLAGWLYF